MGDSMWKWEGGIVVRWSGPELVGPLWVGWLWVEGRTEPVGYPRSVSLGPGLDIGVST